MAEVEGGDDLSEELPGLFGRQPAFFHQVVKQLSAGDMFQHQVPGVGEGQVRKGESRRVRKQGKDICLTCIHNLASLGGWERC